MKHSNYYARTTIGDAYGLRAGGHRRILQSRATPQHRFISIVSCNRSFPFRRRFDDARTKCRRASVSSVAIGACASRRSSIPVAQSGIELRVRLEVQGKNVSTGGTICRVDTFRKHVKCLPRTYPNKNDPPGPPALDTDCGTLSAVGSLSVRRIPHSPHENSGPRSIFSEPAPTRKVCS